MAIFYIFKVKNNQAFVICYFSLTFGWFFIRPEFDPEVKNKNGSGFATLRKTITSFAQPPNWVTLDIRVKMTPNTLVNQSDANSFLLRY